MRPPRGSSKTPEEAPGWRERWRALRHIPKLLPLACRSRPGPPPLPDRPLSRSRLPKLKGFRNRFRTEYQVVNVGDLARLFPAGGTVGPDQLVAVGAVRKGLPVKVLGDGDIAGVTLQVSAQRFSGSARDKIAAAGGSITEL